MKDGTPMRQQTRIVAAMFTVDHLCDSLRIRTLTIQSKEKNHGD
jgi:hypothetical protein